MIIFLKCFIGINFTAFMSVWTWLFQNSLSQIKIAGRIIYEKQRCAVKHKKHALCKIGLLQIITSKYYLKKL